MKIKNSVIISVLLIVFSSLSPVLFAHENVGVTNIDSFALDSLIRKEDKIKLVFEETARERITGSVYYIDTEKELLRDARTNFGSAINGKVPGVFGTYNTWGTGSAVVVVDGIRQDSYYYNSLHLMEIESIVMLKDAVSKALYGAQGDQGVVLINTKRGIDGAQKIRVRYDNSFSAPRTLPNFLNSADYMVRFNEAQMNDGIDLGSLRFSQDLIDSTRFSPNRARYPDNDFYTDEFIRPFTTGYNVFADLMGGDAEARYYVAAEWSQSNGWLNTENKDITDRFNFRSTLDFRITDFMKMNVNASARLNNNQSPNVGDFWNEFASVLPNAYPVLWDPAMITDSLTRSRVLSEANLIDGQVLGGSSTYANNQLYARLAQNGMTRFQQRNVQFGGTLDLDLGFITPGLTAKAYSGMNFYNSLFTQQNYEYAIYEPIFNSITGMVDTVAIHGIDRPSNRYVTNSGNSGSVNQQTYFGNLNYHRSFDLHDVSAVAVIYGDQMSFNGELQKDVLFHTGISANYMYNKRYVAEASLMGIGSRKLAPGQRIELAPSAGLAWIVSEEDFMDDVSFMNYLRLRASIGLSKNDAWDGYHLYSSTFSEGGLFHYFNRTHNNRRIQYSSVANDIWLQKRRDISVGFDASMLNNALNLELGYFNSTSLDNITRVDNIYPEIMGIFGLISGNYNADRTQGIELGFNYTMKASNDFTATVGSNLVHISPKIIQYEQPNYVGINEGLNREGTPTDARWTLIADGLYSENDFNEDGTLRSGLAIPTFGSVQPGDIKYLDQNGDGIIDQLDQRIFGNGTRTQYSVYLDLRYRKFGFYLLGIGSMGGSRHRTGSYFRVFGDVKYSEYANLAYGPDNKDINAVHPRLSAVRGGNNDRNSSFWVYEYNPFVLPTVQLTYHFQGQARLSFLKQSNVYVRGSNLLEMGVNKEYVEVNPTGPPSTRSIVFGLVTSF